MAYELETRAETSRVKQTLYVNEMNCSVLYCIVLYCIDRMVIAVQCTATFSRSTVLPRI